MKLQVYRNDVSVLISRTICSVVFERSWCRADVMLNYGTTDILVACFLIVHAEAEVVTNRLQ